MASYLKKVQLLVVLVRLSDEHEKCLIRKEKGTVISLICLEERDRFPSPLSFN